MIHLPRVLAAAVEVQSLCQQQHWRFCFIGGVAVQRWGEPRLTQDVDLTLLTGFGKEEQFIDLLLGAYSARRADARDFALSHRVLLLRTASGVDVDVALGGRKVNPCSLAQPRTWSCIRLLPAAIWIGVTLNVC